MIRTGRERAFEVDESAVVVVEQKRFQVAVGRQGGRIVAIELDGLGRKLRGLSAISNGFADQPCPT